MSEFLAFLLGVGLSGGIGLRLWWIEKRAVERYRHAAHVWHIEAKVRAAQSKKYRALLEVHGVEE